MKESICFVCAHPDDMIAGAGLAFVLKKSGKYNIHVIDYTHGERGLMGKGVSMEDCKATRTQEEKNACTLLGAELHFMDEIDGEASAGRETCEQLATIFRELKPRAIIAHWPVDCHADHVMSYAAVINACRFSGISPEIYFFEESIQTISMPVMHYVPLDKGIMDLKMQLVRCYACQNDGDHMAKRKYCEAQYNGWKAECEFAECYGSYQRPVPGKPCLLQEL